MKRIYKITLMLLLAGFTKSFAQEKEATKNYDQGFRLGFGINAGYPFSDPYNFNLGADARIQYDLSKRYSLTLTTGFNNYFVSGDNNDLGYIPLKAGFKAFILKDKLYLMGEAGAAFAVTNGYDKTSFLVSPAIGYATDKIDISLRYEYENDFPVIKNNEVSNGLGQISLRLAYGFKL
ncbi:hypothetical protein OX283_013685 [Flavobacterium sp. SUN052]|uniref:hypothetical protein n=1 Tax=Flavobacterium sp. SUN052 TaxID=3002441 RepID=UPI00237E02DE|nr:hypothetical protein [Flavobacterium sp. SUN052]MEC4005717.1 hypothetical protein [Flavobacterium sp. SUN052]